jgi:hypothetical protein
MKLKSAFKLLVPALAFAGFLVLAGCSSPPFKPVRVGIDYSVELFHTNSYRITYHGEKGVPEEEITDFALLRACGVARQQGAAYFAIVNEAESTQDRTVFDVGTPAIVLKPQSGLVIHCFTSRPKSVFVFRVKSIESIMRRKYRPGKPEAKS